MNWRRSLLKATDHLTGGVAVAVLARFLGPGLRRDPLHPSRFLVVRPGGIGDAILLIPALRGLKSRYPSAAVHVLAERRNADVFRWIPNIVSAVYCYDRPSEMIRVLRTVYDAAVDTEQWYRLSAVVTRLIRAGVRVGFSTNSRARLFHLPVAYDPGRYEIENFLALLSALSGDLQPFEPEMPFLEFPGTPVRSTSTMVMAPGASYPEKQWGAEKFRGVVQGVLRRGRKVILVGGPGDTAQAAEIACGLSVDNRTGRTTIRGMAEIIAGAGILVSGDSVALQMAAALGTPSIGIFGPTPPVQWAPRGIPHRTLYHPPPCSPCSRFGHIPPCPYHVECLANVTAEEVLGQIDDILADRSTGGTNALEKG